MRAHPRPFLTIPRLLIVGYLVWICCPGLPVHLHTIGADVGLCISPGGAGFVVLRGAAGRRDARLWMIGGACSAWAVGNLFWTGFVLADDGSIPFPSLADPFYLLFLPLMAAALLALPDTAARAVGRLRALCDSLLSVCGMLALAWPLVLSPVVDAAANLLGMLVACAYGTGD